MCFIIILALILLAVWFFKRDETTSSRSSGEKDSLDMLRARLANGDISEETYDRLKQKLQE